MKWKHYYLALGVFALACFTFLQARRAPATERRDVLVSNYGHMEAREGGKTVVLPLSHTEVKAEVVGVMSSVAVTQHFKNPYSKPLEAVYVFPLPERAAVHAMTMHLGTRQIRAVINKRAEARATYERAKAQGKTAALLEQERPNIFTQSVANVLPGETILVELRYVEELTPREGEYSFFFPMVVGPRYVGEAAPRGKSGTGYAEDTDRVKDASRITPHLFAPGTRSGRDISISLRLQAGVPIADLKVPTHRAKLLRPVSDIASVELDPGDRIPNRDFVVSYRLAGAAPKTALFASHDPRGGHFLLMVQPKHRPAETDLAAKEYVFVADTSGSMDGDPITQVKLAMRLCLTKMRKDDTVQVIRFANSAERLFPAPAAATQHNIDKAVAFLDTMAAGGGTEFIPALELALKAPRDPARARIVVFMTDGYIGYESQVLTFIRQNLGGASLFAFGVGSSVNRYLIDGMARIGGGEPFVLLSRADENVEIQRFFRTVSRPSLTNLTLDWGGLQVTDVTPARIPDLFADKPIVVAGRFGKGGTATATLRGMLAGKTYEQKIEVTLPAAVNPKASAALGHLWARRQIGEWSDRYDAEEEMRPALERRITEVALRYSLMSKFTSFVAVDEKVRTSQPAETVSIPSETPEGVTESAAPPQAFVQGSLSQDQIMPGDPEVRIRAPEARSVTLLFPTGEVKPCQRDRRTGEWVASFLIPESTPDGIYSVRVLIALPSGKQVERVLRYQVDSRAPKVRILLSAAVARPGQLLELQLWPEELGPVAEAQPDDVGDPSFAARVLQDVRSAQALLPSGESAALEHQPDGSWLLRFEAPQRPGRHTLAVVVRDQARNKTRRELTLLVVE